ncbi:MAG: TrkA family potassium uptake protein [Caldisericia bacterium]|nr:TrkA family potassium uptake protein [Caldisericia bacterium]
MHVIVVGGGKVGINLSRELLAFGYSVSIVERDAEKCERIATMMNALVINGDGTDHSILESAGTGQADFMVAVTGRDEDNFVACQLAKITFKVHITMARVNDPRNEPVFNKLGVDFSYTTTFIVSKMILETIKCRYCGFPFVIPEFLSDKSKFEIIRLVLKPTSPSIGKSFAEINIPTGSLAIAVYRNEAIQIPFGDMKLTDNDIVYLISDKKHLESIRGMFLGKEKSY